MSDAVIETGPAEDYGEWGCHMCVPEAAMYMRDIRPETAERKARQHVTATGHDVFVVRGTARLLRVARNTGAGAA